VHGRKIAYQLTEALRERLGLERATSLAYPGANKPEQRTYATVAASQAYAASQAGVDAAQPATITTTATAPPHGPTAVAAPTAPHPKAPKRPRPKRQNKEDVRLLVRTPKTTIPDNPLFLAGLRSYLPFGTGRWIQKITRTNTGIALWLFKGAKAVDALHSRIDSIEEIFQAKFEDAIVERAECWHTRVIDQLPSITLRQAKAELWASTGLRPVRIAVKDAGDGTFRAVAHFSKPPPCFTLFGRWARPVGQKPTRSAPSAKGAGSPVV